MHVAEPLIRPTEVVPDVEHFRMSYEAFLEWEHETGFAEWVNGEVIVHISVSLQHQRLVQFLSRFLGIFAQLFDLGTVVTAPYLMRAAPEGPGREPDVLFVAREHLSRLTSRQLVGPADLVIEVISDESVARDRADKFYEYQDAGIPEYWILDPRPGRQRADFYVLDDAGRYQPVPIAPDGGYRSTVLPGFWLRVAWL